jgi:hypothetical protein
MKRLVSTLILIIPSIVYAQDVKEHLSRYFTEIRSGKYPSIPLPLGLPENAKKTLSAVTPFSKDSSAVVRSKAYAIVRYAGSKSRQANIREQCAMQLLQACRDKNSANVGTALDYLTEFTVEDFTKVAKDTLRNIYKSQPSNIGKVIKLIGFLQLNDLQPSIQVLAQNKDANKFDRWAAQLALARMNNQQMTDNIMTRVKKLEVNDDVVYDIFPDLIYTRQPQAFAYLIEVLNSDTKNCSGADAETDVRIPCAYRVMEQLAPVIEGFPVSLDASGDIDTKDYPGALKTVRNWFQQHKDYKTINNKY